MAQAYERGGGSRAELERIIFAQLGKGPWSPGRKGRGSSSTDRGDQADTSTNDEQVQPVVDPTQEAPASTDPRGDAYERSLELEEREAMMKEKERSLCEREEQLRRERVGLETLRDERRREEREQRRRWEEEFERKQLELKEWRDERERLEQAGQWNREAFAERMNRDIDKRQELAVERERGALVEARRNEYYRLAATGLETLVREDPKKRLLTCIPAFKDAGKKETARSAEVEAVKRKLFCDEQNLKKKREALISKIRETDQEGQQLKERKRALDLSLGGQSTSEMGPPAGPPIKRHKSLPPCINKLPKLQPIPLPPTRERQVTNDPLPLIYPKPEPLRNVPIKALKPPMPPMPVQPPTVRRRDYATMSRVAIFDGKDRHPYTSHFRVTDKYQFEPDVYNLSAWAPKPTGPSAKPTVFSPEAVGKPKKVTKPLEQLMAEMTADPERDD